MAKSVKKYRCIPSGKPLTVVFLVMCLVPIYFALNPEIKVVNSKGEPDPLGGYLVFGFMVALSLGMALFCWTYSARHIVLMENRVICRGAFPWHTFEIEYQKCNVGFDYHVQNGNKIWWIYICVGMPPKYKPGNPANRINSLKIRPGFIKVMYSDEVYNALLAALPKKQRTALETARRCAGFDKQGRII